MSLNIIQLGDYALLCNPYNNRKDCFMWNGEPDGFKQLRKENKEHYKVAFASKM